MSGRRLRGRVRFADQIARGAGLPDSARDLLRDYTPMCSRTGCSLTAATLLLRMPRVSPRCTPPASPRPRPASRRFARSATGVDVRSARSHAIERALSTGARARRACSAQSLAFDETGELESTTFVFDMNKVFEDFVTLRSPSDAAARRYGAPAGRRVLARQGTPLCRPEARHRLVGRSTAALPCSTRSTRRSTTARSVTTTRYQMLAYCTAYGLRRGYLVYAKDPTSEPRTHIVRNSQQRIVVRALDVEREPEALLMDVERLADEVASVVIRAAVRP